jgi:hypothetical protein
MLHTQESLFFALFPIWQVVKLITHIYDAFSAAHSGMIKYKSTRVVALIGRVRSYSIVRSKFCFSYSNIKSTLFKSNCHWKTYYGCIFMHFPLSKCRPEASGILQIYPFLKISPLRILAPAAIHLSVGKIISLDWQLFDIEIFLP